MLPPIAHAYADSAGTPAMLEAELEACRTALGDKHPSTLRVMNNLAVTLVDKGDLLRALVLQKQVLKWCCRMFGAEHPKSLAAMVNLAITHCALGDMAQARVLEEMVLDVRQRNLGDDHPATLSAMGNLAVTINNLAVDLRNAGHLDAAEPLQFQAVALMVEAYGENSLNAASAYSATGALLKLQGEMAQALTYFSRALEIRERELGPDAGLTQLVRSRLRESMH